MHVAICSFIPHRVAPQQSSAMLQTAGTNIMLFIDLNKEKDKILSLQFDLYAYLGLLPKRSFVRKTVLLSFEDTEYHKTKRF